MTLGAVVGIGERASYNLKSDLQPGTVVAGAGEHTVCSATVGGKVVRMRRTNGYGVGPGSWRDDRGESRERG